MDAELVKTLMEIHSKVSVVADKIPGIEASISESRVSNAKEFEKLEGYFKQEINKLEKTLKDQDKINSDRIKVIETRQIQYGTVIACGAFLTSIWGKDIINYIRMAGG